MSISSFFNFKELNLLIIMSLDLTDIIIIIISISIFIVLLIYLNSFILYNLNCCKKKQEDTLILLRNNVKNNSLDDNIKLINNLENQDKELELL